jgi:hypothetical protein
MGIGGEAQPQQTQSAVRPHQGLPSVSLFYLLFLSFLYRTLSGGEPAELMMQQPGRDKGCDEHSGGLHYEH